MNKSLIATLIVSLRSTRALSQAALATEAGVAQATIDSLENQRGTARKSTLHMVISALAQSHPLSSPEVEMAVEATGFEPRMFESMNQKAAQVGEIGDEGVKAEVDAILQLVPPEQFVAILHALRISMQSAKVDNRLRGSAQGTGVAEFQQFLADNPDYERSHNAKHRESALIKLRESALASLAKRDAESAAEHESTTDDESTPVADRLAKALEDGMGFAGDEVGPSGGRIIRVVGPMIPGKIPGTVEQTFSYYEDVPDQPAVDDQSDQASG